MPRPSLMPFLMILMTCSPFLSLSSDDSAGTDHILELSSIQSRINLDGNDYLYVIGRNISSSPVVVPRHFATRNITYRLTDSSTVRKHADGAIGSDFTVLTPGQSMALFRIPLTIPPQISTAKPQRSTAKHHIQALSYSFTLSLSDNTPVPDDAVLIRTLAHQWTNPLMDANPEPITTHEPDTVAAPDQPADPSPSNDPVTTLSFIIIKQDSMTEELLPYIKTLIHADPAAPKLDDDKTERLRPMITNVVQLVTPFMYLQDRFPRNMLISEISYGFEMFRELRLSLPGLLLLAVGNHQDEQDLTTALQQLDDQQLLFVTGLVRSIK